MATAATVLVAGAGPVGLAAAIALTRSGVPALVLDARPEGRSLADPRAVALSHGSRLILERLAVWPAVRATPVRHIEISQDRGFGRAHIEAADHGLDALGYVARLGPLCAALLGCARAQGVEVRFSAAVGAVTGLRDSIQAQVGDGVIEAPLLVRAEGTPDPQDATIKDYRQTAIVAEARGDMPHGFRAHERFTAEGPLALLPLESGYSVVWCMRPQNAAAVIAMDDHSFLSRLAGATRFARVAWREVGPRAAFPLALRRRTDTLAAREVALGNAAQSLHPVAGQGLNLGLRDAFELAACLAGGIDAAALQGYARSRRRDRDAMVATTDAYVSVFSNDFAPLRLARGLGLTLIDLVPAARALVARRMMFGVR
jgi:2-octaprenyl-6-methoxyphenol hydroxylase